MKVLYAWSAAILIIAAGAACNASGSESKGDLATKQAELAKLKKQEIAIGDSIKKVEEEIARLDPSTAIKPKLVGITTLSPQNFTHAIDLQGQIKPDNVVYVAPRGQGGLVRAVYVKQGDYVPKGKLLLKLDDATVRQQIDQVVVQLNLKKDIYERRKNLRAQDIGTEVELLQAKNEVENLQKQIELLKEQQDMSNVYAEISGIADVVNVKVGEFFSPQSAADPKYPGIQLVSNSTLKAVVDIPENYLGSIKRGAQVIVEVPDIHRSYKSTVSQISQQIGATSRSFAVEVKLTPDNLLKANQLVILKIQDYTVNNVMVIPVTTIQTDDKGKYVFVMDTENGKTIARKRQVIAGDVYGANIEIKSGLQAGDKLVTQGYQGLYDGQPLVLQQ